MICKECGKEKEWDSFYKRKNGIPRKECKECFKNKVNKNKNKKNINKKYYKKNKEKLIKKSIEWYESNKENNDFLEKRKNFQEKYYISNLEKERKRNREYYKNNKEKEIIRIKTWIKENREKYNRRKREYYNENKEKIKERNKKYYTPQYRMKKRMSQQLRYRLKKRGFIKNGLKSFLEILPYSFNDFIKSIESKFKEGMNWENYGEWHIDHVTPDSWFDYTSPDDDGFKKSWSLENLQPLWALENLIKNNKYRG